MKKTRVIWKSGSTNKETDINSFRREAAMHILSGMMASDSGWASVTSDESKARMAVEAADFLIEKLNSVQMCNQ